MWVSPLIFGEREREREGVMQHIEDPFESSSSSRDERVEPKAEELLEESWFFGNLLHGRPKTMSRCYSDPSSSSSMKKQLCGGHGFASSGLIRSPSLPSSTTKQDKTRRRGSKSEQSAVAKHNLVRAPSLPPCFGREEDAESEFALSTLIRQASLNSDVLPPRHSSKGVKQGSGAAPRLRPRRRGDQESMDMEGCDQMRRQYLDQSAKMRKSVSDVGGAEGRGSAPNWVEKGSSAEDMKAQIKFWARAVAANVK